MANALVKDAFTAADWSEVQTFDCGDEPYAREVADWLKGPLEADSALAAISNTQRPVRVWLYRREEDEALVGFGALGLSRWRWTTKKDPYIPLTVIVWVALGKGFRGQPAGPKESRYSSLIIEDLVAEALDTKDTHPILGLFVHKDNTAAINLYRRHKFTAELDAPSDPNYLRMARILDGAVLTRLILAAGT